MDSSMAAIMEDWYLFEEFGSKMLQIQLTVSELI
jgi:hypothetical protein